MSRRRATGKQPSAGADPMMARIEAFNEAKGGGVAGGKGIV